MTIEQFISSLTGAEPPAGINTWLKSLWYDGKHNWEEAHNLIQDLTDQNAAWIHAYLHRKEGDTFNANYWYNRAGKKMPAYPLQKEWEELVQAFLK